VQRIQLKCFAHEKKLKIDFFLCAKHHPKKQIPVFIFIKKKYLCAKYLVLCAKAQQPFKNITIILYSIVRGVSKTSFNNVSVDKVYNTNFCFLFLFYRNIASKWTFEFSGDPRPVNCTFLKIQNYWIF